MLGRFAGVGRAVGLPFGVDVAVVGTAAGVGRGTVVDEGSAAGEVDAGSRASGVDAATTTGVWVGLLVGEAGGDGSAC